MNRFNQYIFNLYHYLLNLRDTMEYTIKREHKVALYNQRKEVLTNGLTASNTAMGSFIENNGENGEKLKARIQEFLDEVYSENSTILVPAGETVRVDDGQHVKLFDYVVNLGETLRDVLYGYVGLGEKNKDLDPLIKNLIAADEKLYRTVVTMLILNDFKASFFEFQKVMGESKGQPTPQSNFIVQNEIVKYATFIRFSRQHCRNTDNETLDILDDTIKLIEMTEGRRDRRDDKPFTFFFDEIGIRLHEHVKKLEPIWQEAYNRAVKEVMASQQQNNAGNDTVPADTNNN